MSDSSYIPAWVETISPANATGVLKEAYDWQSARLGAPAEYTQLGSLQPTLVMERLRLYKVIDEVPSGLSEIEKGIVVYLTSVLNETPHCASGARNTLIAEGTTDELLSVIIANPFDPQSGSSRLDAIVVYTAKLTTAPGSIEVTDLDRLRDAGLDDADIVALNNLSAYYAYTNRVATGLGLKSEIPSAHTHLSVPQ